MEAVSDDDVALVYIRLVRKESPDAAALIEQIHRQFGAPAALRAALVITLLKQEIQQYHALPDMGMYTYLLKDSPQAIPFLQEAIAHCLESWGIQPLDNNGEGKWSQTPEAPNAALNRPFPDLFQRVRRHSPITSVKLEQIYRNYGIKAGGYAATALIWFEARIKMYGYTVFTELSDRDIQAFPYVEYMRRREEAVDYFIEMLDCYRTEQQPTSNLGFTTEHSAFQSEQQAARKEDSS